jgi:DNA (cytosine-5)-methyltransferase 1
MELLTTSEMAKKWDISRRVTTLCAERRIEGAILKGNTWLIPENAEKPDDPRRVRKIEQKKC